MSLEQTVDNLEIRYANAVTFVGTSNTMIDTTTGRIQTKGIQHNSNVITDVSGPHGRVAPTLKKYPEIVFEDTSKMDMGEGGTVGGLIFKQAGYTITASSTHPTNGRVPYRAFNGDHTTGWICASSSWNSGTNVYQGGRGIGGYDGEWIKLELPHKIKVETMYIEADLHSGRRPLTGKLLGSDDDSSWAIIKDLTSIPNQNKNTLNIGSTVAYKYIAFLTETIPNGHDTVWIDEIEYYGYEEYTPAGDHSVDTTFMSRFNNPQLTGVQVLVDGATGQGTNQISGGPDPSGNQSTMTSPNKYWTLNGTLTSNLSVEANTFLEGDQPHAVSVWFNSSNLEANVSNTCVFSVSDQEKLDSVNLDLQSNTWHNLTYAYQGEGGSRVTYLDGRKVAEDQAEDTFGEYPPFAMTGYSQGGYVVSASDEDTAYPLWRIFAGDSDYYVSSTSAFPGGVYTSGSTYNLGTNSGGSATDNGHWIKLAVPYKLKISHVNIDARTGYEPQAPKNFKFYGSNDDTNWEQIGPSFSNEAPQDDGTSYYTLNSTKAYKYVGLVVTETVGNGNGRLGLQQLKFYGHRENDLIRLPDPTNVLKYPHIAFPNYDGTASGPNVAPSVRGYVATTDEANPDFPIGKVFDERYQTSGGDAAQRWQTTGSNYPTNGGLATSTNLTLTTLGNGTTYRGNYIQLESPHKLNITKYQIYSGAAVSTHRPTIVVLVGSNTGNTNDWVDLGSGDTTLPAYSGSDPDYSTTATISNTGFYKYHRLIIRALHSTPDPVVFQVKYFGTGVDSIPIQIGGGNIDKVANFRVYDKFIDQNQALEIWDAQKDEFGRAKSSMTLQKGRLGIGTDEPQGRLAVLDEPHNLEEFPPRAMTGYKTHFEGHGVFKASVSEYSGAAVHDGWNAFAHGAAEFWLMGDNAGYNLGSGEYEDNEFRLSSETSMGQWIKLEMPYLTNVTKFILQPRGPGIEYQAPKSGELWGSKDNYTWTKLHTFTDIQYYQGHTTFNFENSGFYKYYGLVVTKVVGGSSIDYISIVDLRYFGTREQGQSVLHDGQLTLTKSLTVPRIGPALDADDTPRRDRLVVEYNTSTNPTFEGGVRDTSGRGNDGVFYGGASYDATEKALVFDGTDDYVFTGNLQNSGGDIDFTISMWIKPNAVTSSAQSPFLLGKEVTNKAVGLNFISTDVDFFVVGGVAYTLAPTSGIFDTGSWKHFILYRRGGLMGVYVNGVYITPSVTGSGSLDLPQTTQFTLGNRDGTNYFNGSISNFKLYDTALTAEEVKTLYDMGRTGSVANPQPLHIATPLYAPGTIVQVEQSIKRDDSSTASTSVSDIPGLSVTIHPKFATSKILVSYQVNMGGNYHMFLRTKRTQNGTTTYVGNGNASGNRPLASSYQSHLHAAHVNSMNMEILDPANGTDPITYQLQFWVSHTNYTAYINRSFDNYNNIYGPAAQSSSITVKEVCQ